MLPIIQFCVIVESVQSTLTYRLYPTSSQEQRLFHYFQVGRTLYNHSLEQRIQHYKEIGKTLSLYDQILLIDVLEHSK